MWASPKGVRAHRQWYWAAAEAGAIPARRPDFERLLRSEGTIVGLLNSQKRVFSRTCLYILVVQADRRKAFGG